MITRSVRGQTFLLRPSPKTNNIVGYCLGYVNGKYNVVVHAVKVMGNHWHAVVTDPDGQIVKFLQEVHSLIARALNAAHGDFESLWSSEQTSLVECAEPSDTIDKISYTMANAVSAGLVRYGHQWPGIRLAWPHPPVTYKRPRYFFSDKMPAEVTFELQRPPGYDDMPDDELAEILEQAITEAEDQARHDADREGRRFLGRKAVKAQNRYGRPSSKRVRFGISPRVAAKNKWRRIEIIQRNRAWGKSYDAALTAWCAGDRTAEFPHGTYKMVVLHGARCVGPPV